MDRGGDGDARRVTDGVKISPGPHVALFRAGLPATFKDAREKAISVAHEFESIKLHLGCGRRIRRGWINLDAAPAPGVDVVADLSQVTLGSPPFEDSSVDEILARRVVDRMRDPRQLLDELYRIARPGCQLILQMPYGSSDEAWVDPSILRPYFLDSFGCFGQPFYWRGDEGYAGDWQLAFALIKMSRARYANVPHAERMADIREKRNVVKEMTAILMAMKPPRPQDRNLVTTPRVEILLVED